MLARCSEYPARSRPDCSGVPPGSRRCTRSCLAARPWQSTRRSWRCPWRRPGEAGREEEAREQVDPALPMCPDKGRFVDQVLPVVYIAALQGVPSLAAALLADSHGEKARSPEITRDHPRSPEIARDHERGGEGVSCSPTRTATRRRASTAGRRRTAATRTATRTTTRTPAAGALVACRSRTAGARACRVTSRCPLATAIGCGSSCSRRRVPTLLTRPGACQQRVGWHGSPVITGVVRD